MFLFYQALFLLLFMEVALATPRCSNFVNSILNNPSMLIDHFIYGLYTKLQQLCGLSLFSKLLC